jgi:ketosteroid isomerase-like protein
MAEDVAPALALARRWFKALDARDPTAAAALVSDDCRITNPAGNDDLVGPAGVRELLRMAPPTLRRSVRDERVEGDTAIITGLTRIPGVLANFTTWTIETDGRRITRVAFAWRAAN